MKSVLIFAALMIYSEVELKAQSDSTKKIKSYLVKIETMGGKNQKGVLYKVSSDTLELLPYSYKYRPFVGSKMLIDESRKLKFTGGEIQSFTIQRKAAMKSAISLGTLIGGITGGIVGAVATSKSDCPPNTICNALNGLEELGNTITGTLIGIGAGALTGFLIGKGKQKKFIIGGNKNKFRDLHAELMEKVYSSQ